MNNIVVAEICSIILTIIILIDIFTKEHKLDKSTRIYVYILFTSVFALIVDIISYILLEKPIENTTFFTIVNTLSYCLGSLIMIPFAYYTHTVIEKHRKHSKLFYHIPVAAIIVNCLFLSYLGFRGILFSHDGSGNGEYPLISLIFFILLLVYFPTLYLILYKRIKTRELLSYLTFIIFPLSTEIYAYFNDTADSYTLVASAYSGLFIYLMLQNENTKKLIYDHKVALELAHMDTLTGLANRYIGRDTISELFEKHEPFAIILLDIDKFKNINDTFGHPTGDEVLKSIAKILKNIFPDSTSVRLGGDEFMVIVEGDKSNEEIHENMKVMFNEITHMHIPGIGPTRKFAVSVGITRWDGISSTTMDELYHIADQGIYDSKKNEGCYYTLV